MPDVTSRRSDQLSPELQDYLAAHSGKPDQVLTDLAAETASSFPDAAGMQIGPDQGTLMTMLARLSGARDALEIGTFTGYSSICIARGLADGGRLICCDVSDEWTSLARRYWSAAGLADRIELRLGPAIDTLAAMPAGQAFDLAFIDADKTGYPGYWEAVVPRIRQGGLILIDNTLSGGRVLESGHESASVQAVKAFNDRAAADDRVDVVLVPIGDGLTLARKRSRAS
jgi:caffeoyl-CoA O-methyltransferase